MAKTVNHHMAAFGLAFAAAVTPALAVEKIDPIPRRSTELSTAVPDVGSNLNQVRPVPVSPFELAVSIIDRAEIRQKIRTNDPGFAFSEAQRDQHIDRLARAIQLKTKQDFSCASMTAAVATTPGDPNTAVHVHTAFGLQPGHPFVYVPASVPNDIFRNASVRRLFPLPPAVPVPLNLPIYPDVVTQANKALKQNKTGMMPFFVSEKSADKCVDANLIPASLGI